MKETLNYVKNNVNIITTLISGIKMLNNEDAAERKLSIQTQME